MRDLLHRIDTYFDLPSFTPEERERINAYHKKLCEKHKEKSLDRFYCFTPCGWTEHTRVMDISEKPSSSSIKWWLNKDTNKNE